MTQITGLLFIAAWTSLAQARNETIVHGWQPEPSGRGTWSIVWSCLTTILLCTWSALHLPVPDWSAVHSDIQSWLPGGTPEHYDTWWLFSRRFRKMMLAIILPELMMVDAISEYTRARFYARQTPDLKADGWTSTHLRFADAGGFSYRSGDSNTKVSNMHHLVELIQSQKLENPPVLAAELNSRSQSDWFIKVLTMCQIIWFGIQLLFRAIQHIQNTALEISVVAFVFCSVAVYAFNWNLPQNVEYPVMLTGKNDDYPTTGMEEPERVKTEYFQLALFGTLFGAVHCLAWDSPFPTPEERLTWRICAALTTGLPPIISRGVYLGGKRDDDADPPNRLILLSFVLFAGLYSIGRITLIILAFTALRALPADVYQTIDWTNYIPHVGV